jgi:UDP-GlcNAc:undecaprenyl-phosphate/decaprenyl-phosphate GlcNAc-1-phosphate transferase
VITGFIDIVMINYLKENNELIYALFFMAAVTFSFLINGLFLRFFRTLGIRNNTDGTIIRWGTYSKPSVGGITFYIVFLLSIASYTVIFNPPDSMYQYGFVGLLLSCASGFLVGLADDAYDTKPFLKFGIQLLCGIILVASGIVINITPWVPFNYFLTLFWVVGIMNSVNMLDNMDGITAIVSAGVIINTLIKLIIYNDISNMHFISLIGVLASLCAFLWFNWHPSKMYMGDTGSQFLGVYLAAMGIVYFWNDPFHTTIPAPTGKLVASVVMAFILPIVDTTVVVYNRLSKGKSPFIGGRDHTTHSLAYLGLSDRQVAGAFIALVFCSFCQNIIIEKYLTDWQHAYTVIFAIYFFSLLAFFFYTTRNKQAKTTASEEKSTTDANLLKAVKH